MPHVAQLLTVGQSEEYAADRPTQTIWAARQAATGSRHCIAAQADQRSWAADQTHVQSSTNNPSTTLQNKEVSRF
jgi:uncharacterized iron-regulated membrane protein